MELFKDLNWALVMVLAVMGAAPLIFIDKPIKDRRWAFISAFFLTASIVALFYFIFFAK